MYVSGSPYGFIITSLLLFIGGEEAPSFSAV